MWIHTLHWSASIASHAEREDIFIVRFCSQLDANAFIQAIDEYVLASDYEQRRALNYHSTPGLKFYQYRIAVRREYVCVLVHYALLNLQYVNFLQRVQSIKRTIRTHIRSCWLQSIGDGAKKYMDRMWTEAGEKDTAYAFPEPVYIPKRLEESCIRLNS